MLHLSLLNSIKGGLRYFIFAPECLECRALLPPEQSFFCLSCITLLNLLEPIGRCERCFKEVEQEGIRVCQTCLKTFHPMIKVAAACEYLGPAATMIRLMKYGNQPELAEAAAAYIVMQWVQLDWPCPDYIVPVPCSWLRQLERGYNQAELIARALGKLINVPVNMSLKRRVGDYSQAGLSREQRLKQPLTSFYMKDGFELEDKTVLLVDDVMTTGRTLNVCAETLHSVFPRDIYAMTFCRAGE